VSHPESPDRPPESERASFRRSDFTRLRHALREQWGVPGIVRNEAVFQAARILSSEKTTPRDKLAAARFLVAADHADVAAGTYAAKYGATEGGPELADSSIDPAAAAAALRAAAEAIRATQRDPISDPGDEGPPLGLGL
jgi:hypothetical protein